MDFSSSAAGFKSVRKIQRIWQILSVLRLTGYMWPQPACVPDGATYDFIIIGGGTAGSVIANRLVTAKASVLLVEAGEEPPFQTTLPYYFSFLHHTNFNWNYTTDRNKYARYHKNKVFEATQGKVLGGSGSINYMLYNAGTPYDFDRWANITRDSSWSWESVAPIFYRSEKVTDQRILNSPDRKYHGTKGPILLTKYYAKNLEMYFSALKELGNNIVADINANNVIGYTSQMFNIGRDTRISSAVAFLSPIKDNSKLDVLTNTLATKIIFDENKNAVGVKLRLCNNKYITVRARKEVIVTAGAINSAILLMRSGIGPKEHLKSNNIKLIADSRDVGRNLQDSPNCVLIYKVGKAITSRQPQNPHEFPVSVIDGYESLEKSKTKADFQALIGILDAPESLFIYCNFFYNFNTKLCDTMSRQVSNNQLLFINLRLLYPKSRGEVTLRSADVDDLPVIKINYYSDSRDLESHIKFIEHFNAIQNTTYFRKENARLLDPKLKICKGIKRGTRDYWRCYIKGMVTSNQYFVGTCAMGTVVHPNLLVKGVNKLRVADASIMPVMVGTSPQATVIMIAQKASDMIIQDHNLQ